ncbi:hypothetical protein H6P81_003501 [Aristolochia fimbriata]|uniref:Acyl carrier protein n=1 Tax=Aristolochia fimbriata TaxID=158543 RepID=A0AAV7FCY5_ARIFI|nr:hypothetical protein H6P81_003501 [Aristolochia fimbriata]
MMQALRTGIRILRSFAPSNVSASTVSPADNGVRVSVLGLLHGSRGFAQAAACSPSTYLDKDEVTNRVVNLLKSTPFIDPDKVKPSASFKDMQLDALDSVEVMVAAEEEFAVDIPNTEADKISSTSDLINYIVAHPQAK